LVADNDNLRAARAWALEWNISSALRLLGNITPSWNVIIPVAEALQYSDMAIDRAESSPDFVGPAATAENRRLLGNALATASYLSLTLGTAMAGDYSVRGIAIAREQDDENTLVLALMMGTAAAIATGDFDSARQNFQEFFPLVTNMDPSWTKGMALTSFGLIFVSLTADGLAGAWEEWETGMVMFRQSGEFWGLAYGHQMAAQIAFHTGDPAKAQYHAKRSIDIYTEFGETHMVNTPRSLLADLARQRGEIDEATSLYREVVSGWRNVGQYGAMARCLECMAFVGNARAGSAGDESRSQYFIRSATLLGVAEAIRQAHNSPMTASEETEYGEELALIKEAAGESTFKNAWLRGQVMDPDQAVAFAQEM
jgi:hypothetical protein